MSANWQPRRGCVSFGVGWDRRPLHSLVRCYWVGRDEIFIAILDRGDSKLVGNRKPKLERSNGTWSLSDFLSAALTGPLSANKSAAVLYTFVLSGPQTQLLNKLLTQSGE